MHSDLHALTSETPNELWRPLGTQRNQIKIKACTEPASYNDTGSHLRLLLTCNDGMPTLLNLCNYVLLTRDGNIGRHIHARATNLHDWP